MANENKRDIALATNFRERQRLCQHLNYCDGQSSHQCILSLTAIFYSAPLLRNRVELTTRHYSQIRSVKLNLVITDFTKDSLKFNKNDYNFQLSAQTLMNSNDDSIQLGLIKAVLDRNTDFNSLVRYYLDFDAASKADLIELFSVDSLTGQLSLRRREFASDRNNFNKEFLFYVEAMSQCGDESPLRSRAVVRVRVVDLEAKQLHVTQLLSNINLTESFECVKLTSEELATESRIALAQVGTILEFKHLWRIRI